MLNDKGFIQPSVLFILLLILITVILFFYFLVGKTPSTNSTTTPVQATSTPETNIVYNDPEGRFSLQYPYDLNLSHKENQDYRFNTNFKGQNIHLETKLTGIDGENYSHLTNDQYRDLFYLNIFVIPNINHLSNEDLKEKLISLEDDASFQEKAVNEKIKNSLKEYENDAIKGYFYIDGWDYDFQNVVFATDKFIYTINYTGDNGGAVSEESEAVIKNIISSIIINQ